MATPYRKKYCDSVIAHFSAMRKNGKGVIVGAPSFVSFAESIGVTLGVLERWRRDYPDFDKACLDACEISRQLLMDAALSEFGMGKSHQGEKEVNTPFSEWDKALVKNLAKRLGLDESTL